MKTYRITDEDGKVVEVKEYDEGEEPEEGSKPAEGAKPAEGEKPAAPAKPEEEAHDEAFSPEQVEVIKKLIAEALAAAKNADEPAPEAEAHDEDIDSAKEDNGEGGAIQNANAPKVGDSKAKKGAGSVEQKPSKANDSLEINQEEVDNAWGSRFSKDK